MAKVVIVELDDKKVVRYQSSNTGKVQAFEDMNWKHFENAYNKLCNIKEYDLISLEKLTNDNWYSQHELLEYILIGEAAKRVLLSKDWKINKDIEEIEAEIEELETKLRNKRKERKNLQAE